MRQLDKDQTSLSPFDAPPIVNPVTVSATAVERPIARVEQIRADLRQSSNPDRYVGTVGQWTNWRNV